MAGDDGSVWSCWKRYGTSFGQGKVFATWVIGKIWRKMKCSCHKNGRRRIELRKKKLRRMKYLAPLILETFAGPRPKGMECCHNDGNLEHNYLSNLRWDTHKNNQLDTYLHGTMKATKAKLSYEDRCKIKERAKNGEAKVKIAKDFNVHKSTIFYLLSGRTWNKMK